MGAVSVLGCGSGGGGSSGPTASIADAVVSEGDAGTRDVTFTVTLSAPLDEEVQVSWASAIVSGADGATPGVDYLVPIPGTLVFDPGVTTRTLVVSVVGDSLDELDERFEVRLLLALGPVGLGDTRAFATIVDDDPEPALSIDDVAIDEGDAGTRTLSFALSLSVASGREVRVAYSTSNGTASSGSDYVAASGTQTLSAGLTTRALDITIQGDALVENDETFSVSLSAPVGATLADATGVGTIRNDDSTAALGLDARPANATCIAPARPTSDASIDVVEAFPTAPDFAAMTKILQAPGDSTRWFVLEKSGRIKVLPVANPAAAATWIDLSDRVEDPGEGGLLGLAFHPSWPSTRQVFVSYTTTGSPLVSRVSRLILDDVVTPSPPTEQILLTVDQPFDNHNGGEIAFGGDGFLYFGLGDGGSGDDPFNYSQNPTRLLGKMLRIGVVGVAFPSPGYTIPSDNPNAANPKCGPGANAQACPEIYATGFRNPWRFGFDQPSGLLYVGDVGEGSREEIDLVERGGNYGWNCREGLIAHASSGDCSGAFIEPLVDIAHSTGNNAVTGGYVYRGSAIPALQGRYVFGDFQSGRIFALVPDGAGGFTTNLLASSGNNISAFGLANDGELYVASFTGNRILRLDPASGGGAVDTIPSDLADTGCAAAGDASQPSSGLVPYGLQAPFWSDGATKSRWLSIPDGTTITVGSISGSAGGDFTFPNGSVIRKDFRLNGQLIETRLLMRHPDGIWGGYTYEWNDAQTAATRVVGGKLRSVQGQSWIYPSEAACMQCHTATAGFALGPEISQLNGLLTYPSTGRTANQVDTLAGVGFFSAALPGPSGSLPRLADPSDVGATLGARARAWLHTNCSQCHRPSGPTPSSMDLRASTALSATNACNVSPQSGSFGIANARLIAPGDSGRSIILYRASRRDANGMPPIGSHLVDSTGVSLLDDWIESLSGCN